MFERILVGVDAEGAGDHAVVAAGRLAERLGGKIEYVHAIPVVLRAWSGPAIQAWEAARDDALAVAKEACAQRVDAVLQQAGLSLAPAREQMAVVEGHPGEALLRQEPGPDDLVVLGGHRQLGVLHLGSTARSVLSRADCPVWVQKGEAKPVERVLAAVDLSGHSEAVADRALALANALEVPMLLVHCFEEPRFRYGGTGIDFAYTTEDLRRDSRTAFDVFVERVRPRCNGAFEATFDQGEPSERLLETARAGDLVVMGTHGHSSFLRMVLGSHAYKVVKQSEQPVLVVPQLRVEE